MAHCDKRPHCGSFSFTSVYFPRIFTPSLIFHILSPPPLTGHGLTDPSGFLGRHIRAFFLDFSPSPHGVFFVENASYKKGTFINI